MSRLVSRYNLPKARETRLPASFVDLHLRYRTSRCIQASFLAQVTLFFSLVPDESVSQPVPKPAAESGAVPIRNPESGQEEEVRFLADDIKPAGAGAVESALPYD